MVCLSFSKKSFVRKPCLTNILLYSRISLLLLLAFVLSDSSLHFFNNDITNAVSQDNKSKTNNIIKSHPTIFFVHAYLHAGNCDHIYNRAHYCEYSEIAGEYTGVRETVEVETRNGRSIRVYQPHYEQFKNVHDLEREIRSARALDSNYRPQSHSMCWGTCQFCHHTGQAYGGCRGPKIEFDKRINEYRGLDHWYASQHAALSPEQGVGCSARGFLRGEDSARKVDSTGYSSGNKYYSSITGDIGSTRDYQKSILETYHENTRNSRLTHDQRRADQSGSIQRPAQRFSDLGVAHSPTAIDTYTDKGYAINTQERSPASVAASYVLNPQLSYSPQQSLSMSQSPSQQSVSPSQSSLLSPVNYGSSSPTNYNSGGQFDHTAAPLVLQNNFVGYPYNNANVKPKFVEAIGMRSGGVQSCLTSFSPPPSSPFAAAGSDISGTRVSKETPYHNKTLRGTGVPKCTHYTPNSVKEAAEYKSWTDKFNRSYREASGGGFIGSTNRNSSMKPGASSEDASGSSANFRGRRPNHISQRDRGHFSKQDISGLILQV